MMTSAQLQDADARAREHARLGIYNPEEFVLAAKGPSPEYDPVANLEHAAVGNHLQNPVIDELEQDIHREEDDLARHTSPHGLLAFLGVLLFMEAAGAIYVMRTLGIASPERIIFGTALAICVFFATWLCSRARNRMMAVVGLSGLGLLIAAVTIIRVDENASESSSRALDWASAFVMMAVTIGPALMAEHVMRLLAPALPLVRRARRLRTRRRNAIREQRRANRFVQRLARRRDRWQHDAQRLRAAYDGAWRAARAEMGEVDTSLPDLPSGTFDSLDVLMLDPTRLRASD